MLNYVWLALLFLGIGSALSTDIINQSQDKYRNNVPLPLQVKFSGDEQQKYLKDGSYDAEILISKDQYNAFYKTKIKDDIVVKGRITVNNKENKNTLYIKVNDNTPALWQEMAAASGEKDDLTGNIHFNKAENDTSISANVILEEISFTSLKKVTNSALDYAGTAVNIALGLIGIMALWLGVMKVAEQAGLIRMLAKLLRPVTKMLFPEIPHDHPAVGSMIMNISANMLGLGNAATPFGLKAMEELNTLNPDKDTASDSMITFLAINTAGLTIIPASAIALRAASGSSDPAVIIGTSLFGSLCATITGITAAKLFHSLKAKDSQVSWFRRNIKIFSFILITTVVIALFIVTGAGSIFSSINPEVFKEIIQVISTLAIPFLIVFFIGYGAVKKVRIYEQFVEGAKEGFNVAVRIIPYLVAMLVAIGIFRAGGAMEWLVFILKPFTDFIGMPAEALPMALMRPLSGSGSLGIMAEIMKVHGPDSLIGIMVSTFYGSTETTFYVLAVYFGAVNIKNTRYALPVGLIADAAGLLAAVFIVKLLFG